LDAYRDAVASRVRAELADKVRGMPNFYIADDAVDWVLALLAGPRAAQSDARISLLGNGLGSGDGGTQ
jgi:hypothetical protein